MNNAENILINIEMNTGMNPSPSGISGKVNTDDITNIPITAETAVYNTAIPNSTIKDFLAHSCLTIRPMDAIKAARKMNNVIEFISFKLSKMKEGKFSGRCSLPCMMVSLLKGSNIENFNPEAKSEAPVMMSMIQPKISTKPVAGLTEVV